MALAVVTSAIKLRRISSVILLSSLLIKLFQIIMQDTNQSARLTKWAIELREHDIS